MGATAGALVLAPVLVGGRVVRGLKNSKVNGIIEARQTSLPLQVAAGTATVLDVFFPIAPSPTDVRIKCAEASGQCSIALHTAEALAGLHLVPAEG